MPNFKKSKTIKKIDMFPRINRRLSKQTKKEKPPRAWGTNKKGKKVGDILKQDTGIPIDDAANEYLKQQEMINQGLIDSTTSFSKMVESMPEYDKYYKIKKQIG